MTETSQHELHPGAEQLSAFAEQALGARERDQVLLHLAACNRCRQVIALTQQAAGLKELKLDEVELEAVALPAAAAAPALRSAPYPPGAWWKRWRLVWAPAAVAAALVVTSLYIYLRQAEKTVPTNQVAKQEAAPAAESESPTPPVKVAKNTPPPAMPRPSARANNAVPLGATRSVPPDARMFKEAPKEQSLQRGFDRAAGVRPPAETESVQVVQDQNVPQTVTTDQVMPIESQAQQLANLKAQQPPANAKKVPQPAQGQSVAAANRQREIVAAQAKLSAPSPAPPPEAASSPPAGAPVAASQQPAEAYAGAAGTFSALRGSSVAGMLAGRSVHLPSGLAALSIASAGPRLIAIDKAGSVFLSEDSDSNWRRIEPQWAGRAVLVRTRSVPRPVVPSPAAESTQSVSGAAPAAEPITLFEIVNDKNQVFQSIDGTTWIAK
jgi:hypothetical protein